jgi:hypothetical protein
LVGIALLFATPASAAESILDVLRGGGVHHESAPAVDHRGAAPHRGHCHDDSLPTHEHGTPADHCTHVHSVAALPEAFQASLGAPVSVVSQAEPAVHGEWLPFDEFDPPRP